MVLQRTQIVNEVKGKDASRRVLGMSLDTGTAQGRLMLQVLTAVAEHERQAMLKIGRSSVYRAMRERKIRRVTGVAAAS